MTHGITLGTRLKTWCMAAAIAGITSACDKNDDSTTTVKTAEQTPIVKVEDPVTTNPQPNNAQPINVQPSIDTSARLMEVVDSQEDSIKARYPARKPQETLEFFGIKPGMTVVEVLPGDGWYTKILIPYLGGKGSIIAVDYPYEIWHHFNWASRDFIQDRKNWSALWEEKSNAWYIEDAAPVTAFSFENIPEEQNEKADAVLFIRALHNLNRFESRGQFFTNSLKRTHELLKKGGALAVVQHEAPEDKSLEWADGSRGYLNKADLIKKIESFGFTLEKESDIHKNELDKPGEDDSVWRLPPSYSTSENNEVLKEQMTAIGESNRMTLLFRKN